MKKLLPLLLMLLAFRGMAVDLITATITITNNPTTNGQTLTVNGVTKTWTNSISGSPSTLILTTNSPANAATNLLNTLTSYPFSPAHYLSQNNATNVTLRGRVGEALTVSAAGEWAVITYGTNVASSPTYIVRVPLAVEQATNQTNIASLLVTALESSIKPLGTNATAGANYLTKGASPVQSVSSPVLFGSVGGSVSALTNGYSWGMNLSNALVNIVGGYLSNIIAHSIIMTNGINYGNALSSPGAYVNSQQFGGASVTGGNSTSVGTSANAATNATAFGYLASAGYFGVAIGSGADSSASTNSVAVGQNSSVGLSSNAIAFGQNSIVGDRHHGSVAIGQNSSTTTNNQVVLGSSSHTVSIPGVLAISGTQSNTTFTGTNVFAGRIDWYPRSSSSLANGNNAGVVLGTNTYVRLSGATTIAALCGFSAEQDGSWHIIQISGSVTNTLANESGVEPTAANRILTGTGADVSFTNSPTILYLIYDASASRWRLRLDR